MIEIDDIKNMASKIIDELEFSDELNRRVTLTIKTAKVLKRRKCTKEEALTWIIKILEGFYT